VIYEFKLIRNKSNVSKCMCWERYMEMK